MAHRRADADSRTVASRGEQESPKPRAPTLPVRGAGQESPKPWAPVLPVRGTAHPRPHSYVWVSHQGPPAGLSDLPKQSRAYGSECVFTEFVHDRGCISKCQLCHAWQRDEYMHHCRGCSSNRALCLRCDQLQERDFPDDNAVAGDRPYDLVHRAPGKSTRVCSLACYKKLQLQRSYEHGVAQRTKRQKHGGETQAAAAPED